MSFDNFLKEKTEIIDAKLNEQQGNTIQVFVPEQKPLDVHEQANQAVALAMRDQTQIVLADERTQDKMQKAATTVIEKKVDTVVKTVTGENNEINSLLEEEALNCFGYKAGRSIRRWQIIWAGYYHSVLSAIWMFIAMFTFSPIIFVAKKVHNAAKVTWWGIVLGLFIWVAIIITPILIAVT